MNKRLKIILIITCILILLGMKSVFAVNGSFSINKSNVELKVGETSTFSVTATNCAGKFTITSSNASVATVNVASEWIENSSKEITITAKSAGTATITIKAEDVASTEEEEVTGSKTIQVTVSKKETNNSNGNSTSNNGNEVTPSTPATPPAPATKSTEAKLQTLGIRPNDFSGFSKNRNKEDWSVEVPNSVSEVEVYATAMSDKAKVEGTGKISLKEGSNVAKIKVTAEAGNTKTYTLIIKRKTADEETTENSEARLKTLGIKPEQYDFTGFKSDIMEYSVEVPNEVEQIEIYATAINSNAQITGIGNKELNEGENVLPIEVIAKDGTQKTYTIKVTRAKSENEKEITGTTQKFGLSELTVKGFTLSPKFSTGVYEYTIGLREDLESLEIDAKATNNEAKVEVIGNENLKQGENIITIIVKGENAEDVETYQIIVNKNTVIEEKTSWLKPETWGKEEKIKIAIVVTIIVLIIIAIILKIKISKQEQEENLPNLPGGDELDKAIAEHQELTEDFTNDEEEQNEDIYQFEQEDIKKEKRKGRHF